MYTAGFARVLGKYELAASSPRHVSGAVLFILVPKFHDARQYFSHDWRSMERLRKRYPMPLASIVLSCNVSEKIAKSSEESPAKIRFRALPD